MQTNPIFHGDSSAVTPGEHLEVADRIGVTLCRDAVWSAAHCTWMGWSMTPLEGSFSAVYKTSDSSLYGGLAGIAVFLAKLHAHTGDPLQKATVLGAINNLLAQDPDQLPAGLYTGLLGIGYALAQIGETLGSGALIERALDLAEAGATAPLDPTQTDVLAGSAGIIPGLVTLGVQFDRPDFLDHATRHADFLVEQAIETPTGVAWPNPMRGEPPLLGYSHGTAGYALALAEIDHVRPDARHAKTARAALKHERSLFNAQVCNWPDLRTNPTEPNAAPHYPTAWCHGAAGIGLARVRLSELLGDTAELTAELDAGLQTASASLVAQQSGVISDFSYCHGSIGNAELLLEIALKTGRDDILEGVRRFGDIGAQAFAARGLPWPCGVQGAGSTPGLMLGTAGIGWFYLRLFDPSSTPSLLVIRPNLLQTKATQ